MDRNPQELANFGGIRSHELTPELTFKHLSLLTTALEWLRTVGQKRLESTEPLDYQTWHELFENSFQVYCAGGCHFTFQYQFVMVIERGIKDLRSFTERHLQDILQPDDEGNLVRAQHRSWFQGILYQLRMGARLGFHAHPATNVDPKVTIRLLKGMTEIAELTHKEHFLRDISVCLYPGYDEGSREMFVAHHKNW